MSENSKSTQDSRSGYSLGYTWRPNACAPVTPLAGGRKPAGGLEQGNPETRETRKKSLLRATAWAAHVVGRAGSPSAPGRRQICGRGPAAAACGAPPPKLKTTKSVRNRCPGLPPGQHTWWGEPGRSGDGCCGAGASISNTDKAFSCQKSCWRWGGGSSEWRPTLPMQNTHAHGHV